jgi:4-amino-4-deoxy-L-arabinose transferase-like glycosyltransferase
MHCSWLWLFDELYTNALSRHLAFGYVDLPPLVPALVALSRFLFGESLFAMHIVPALAGSFTLVFACLITKEFGGKTFAVALTALGFIIVPGWLMVDSIFCYDSIDQLILAAFLFHLVRFLRTGNKKLWIVLGLIAGLRMTKMTIFSDGFGCASRLEVPEGFDHALAVVGSSTLPDSCFAIYPLAICQPLANT